MERAAVSCGKIIWVYRKLSEGKLNAFDLRAAGGDFPLQVQRVISQNRSDRRRYRFVFGKSFGKREYGNPLIVRPQFEITASVRLIFYHYIRFKMRETDIAVYGPAGA